MTTYDDVSIVGVGLHPFGRHDPALTGMSMGANAIRLALADAGVSLVGHRLRGRRQQRLRQAGHPGQPTRPDRRPVRQRPQRLRHRRRRARDGRQRDPRRRGRARAGRRVRQARARRVRGQPGRLRPPDWYAETGLMITTQFFAMKDRRYLHQHGLKDQLLAQVAAKAFRNGALNPDAWRRTELSEDEILAARVINPPLTQYMFCSPSEGACAVVLARSRPRSRPVRAAGPAGRGEQSGPAGSARSRCSPRGCPPEAARARAWTRRGRCSTKAGVAPSDVQVAQLQDTDSGAEIYHMAETGLCEHGAQQATARPQRDGSHRPVADQHRRRLSGQRRAGRRIRAAAGARGRAATAGPRRRPSGRGQSAGRFHPRVRRAGHQRLHRSHDARRPEPMAEPDISRSGAPRSAPGSRPSCRRAPRRRGARRLRGLPQHH